MRIKRLSLEPFGQFKNLDLDLPASGICFVYGLNGAGKTTVRQSILDLLFGMPARVNTDWNFSWKFGNAVQVRAILEGLGDGSDLEVVRGKEREDSLRGADGSPLAEDLFTEVTGGRNQELFAGLFSISHEEIRQFGQELASGKADRETLVFGPGLGGSPQLLRALTRIKEESEDLFLSATGTNQTIPETISKLKERLEQASEQRVPPFEWTQKERERARLEKEEGKLEKKKGDLEAELRSKKRYLSVLSEIRTFEALEETASDQSTIDSEEAVRRKVETLHQQVSLVENNIRERALKERAKDEVDTDSILESLGIPAAKSGRSPDVDAVVTMFAPDLVTNYLSEPAASPAIDGSLRKAIQELQSRIAGLRFFQGDGIQAFLDLLSNLPDRAVIDDYQEREAELRKGESDLREKIRDASDERGRRERDLKVLDTTTPVPTRQEIAEARSSRDSIWQAIRSAWLDGDEGPGRKVSDEAEGRELPEVFESAVSEADEMGDRRAELAKEANRAETLRAEIETLDDQEKKFRDELEEITAEKESLLASFREVWAGVAGIDGLDEPLLIQTMVDWLETVAEIKEDEAAIYAMVEEIQEELQRESGAIERLSEEIGRLSPPIDAFVASVVNDVAGRMGDEVDPDDPAEVVVYLQGLHARIKARKDAEREKDELEKEILAKGKEDIKVLKSATKGMDPDQLEADIDALASDLDELTTERKNARIQVEEIITWQATAAAGKLARQSEYEALVLRESLQEEVSEFIRLKMAMTILEQAQKSYASKASGPVLKRALEILSSMTGGLVADFDVKKKSGKERLVVKRVDGQDVEVNYLSDGERDSLAFALRVATLEYLISSLEVAERPPVVFDDSLVNLDDEKAQIGIGCLAPLSEMTQVLFFTHHGHMLELAEKELQPSEWSTLTVIQPTPEGLAV